MHCIFCHKSSILNLNPKTQVKRKLIMYNTINVITTLKKHVNSYHCNFFLNLKKINSPLKEDERQP
jgi:hypothetical protein